MVALDVLSVLLPSYSFICDRLRRSGDEDLPHVPHREHQRREQAEGRREAGGEAVRQVRRAQRQPAASRRPPAEARLRQKNREDEREGEVHSALILVGMATRLVFMNIGSSEQNSL